ASRLMPPSGTRVLGRELTTDLASNEITRQERDRLPNSHLRCHHTQNRRTWASGVISGCHRCPGPTQGAAHRTNHEPESYHAGPLAASSPGPAAYRTRGNAPRDWSSAC